MKKVLFVKKDNGRHWVGDGFPVRGIFSYTDIAKDISPFLLMDYAGPVLFPPTSQKLGVGQHPHRGFETVTVVYDGGVSHRDSSGSGGTIGAGDVQWMTAGAGVIHEEYHSESFSKQGGMFEMVQLWVNLPASDKMVAPTYQGILANQIPTMSLGQGAGALRLIAGEFDGSRGPAHTFTPINLWDLRLTAGQDLEFVLPEGHTTLLFVLKGLIGFSDGHKAKSVEMAVMTRAGSQLSFRTIEDSTVLLLSGQPIDEPIVGYGPFVMNTEIEIRQAIQDFKSGIFGQIDH